MIHVSRWRITSRMAPLALLAWLRLFIISAAPRADRMMSGM